MLKIKQLLLVSIILLITVSAIFPVTLKLGSLAPRNSPWDETLNEIAAEWKRISDGRVELKIYPGGITGNEEDSLRKMRVGALDGMVVSSMGLNKISPDLLSMSLPLVIRNEGELDYVMENIKDTYSDIISEEGFVLVGWTKAGWMHIFSRDPVYYPDDLEKQKLGFTTGEEVLTKILKDLGFHVVPADSIDWLAGLQSGRTDALIISPLLVAAYQLFPIADNMLDFQISPLMGAIVLSERSWRKVPVKYREEFLLAAGKAIVPLDTETKDLEKRALEIMLENGLTVNQASEEEKASWIKLIDELYESGEIIGDTVSREIFDEVVSYTEEYRKLYGSDEN